MSYLCDLFFISIFPFIVINRTNTILLFIFQSEYIPLFLDDNVDEECE